MTLDRALPAWVRPYEADSAAAAMIRELRGPSADWGSLVATAQTILSAYQDFEGDPSDLYDVNESRGLFAAGRVLDAASRELSGLPQDHRSHLAVQASLAFSMCGNFPAARAVFSTLSIAPDSPSLKVVLGSAAPQLVDDLIPSVDAGTPHKRYLESLSIYLASGDQDQESELDASLIECIRATDEPWESALLRSARLTLRQIQRLAVAKSLLPYSQQLPNGFVSRILSTARLLLPPQHGAISNGLLSESSTNALLALPTGTGKTLLGELCLAVALGRQPGLVCFVTPYVALGRQVFEAVRRHFPGGVRAHQLFGNYQESETIDPSAGQEFVVATPERLDALLRTQPTVLQHLRAIVFDEAHIIETGDRGVRVEVLLARIRLRQRQLGNPRLVLLSAVLSNVQALSEWLGIQPNMVFRDNWRSTARRLMFWSEDGSLKYHAGDDVMKSASVPAETVIAEKNLPWPRTEFYSTRNLGPIQQQQKRSNENVAYLVDSEYRRFQEPVLCVCATRGGTRQLCRALSARMGVLEPLPSSLARVIDLIDARFPYLRSLRDGLSRGVTYHNSSLPHIVRQAIEEAIGTRSLKAVAATTTLAEGVDLPFRVTILADWLFWGRLESPQPMSSLLFRNIAGRCGRPGQFTEGDVLIYDNPAGDARHTHPARRRDLQRQIFFTDDAPILHTSIDNSPSAKGVLGSQLLAAVQENPGEDDLSRGFYSATLAARLDADAQRVAEEAIAESVASLVDVDPPLARAASPLLLNELGEAVSPTGLSPVAARRLIGCLTGLAETSSLPPVAATFLTALADVPEQQNRNLQKTVLNPNSRFMVKPADFESLIRSWLGGIPLEEMFQSLPANQRSTRQPQLALWLQGFSDESRWEEEFEKFSEFVQATFENYLPWLLRASATLVPIASSILVTVPWLEWARRMEYGVEHSWALWALDQGAPPDRQALTLVASSMDSRGVQPAEAMPGTAAAVTPILQAAIGEVGGAQTPLGQAVSRIYDWYMSNFG